jgi:CubicO group peptidase (beta-lactamase class C family)
VPKVLGIALAAVALVGCGSSVAPSPLLSQRPSPSATAVESTPPSASAGATSARTPFPTSASPVPNVSASASIPPPAASATPSPSDPASRVAAVFTGFSESFATVGITATSPGCAVAISDHGVVVYAKGFGLANLTTKTPITPTTVMEVGSVSKEFTGAAILLLAQEHKLSLSDDIHQYVPELPAYGHPMPLQDMLWMESGIPDYVDTPLMTNADYGPSDHVTIAESLAVIAKVTTLDFAPGTQYAYSNSNYLLLGIVVARVSGMSLAAFVQQNVFKPLGMTATFIQEHPGTPVPNGATSYDLFVGGVFKPDVANWIIEGPGGVQSNVLDLLRWAANFTSGTVGGPAFLHAQLKTGPADTGGIDGLPAAYAVGLVVSTYKGQQLIWHNGAWEGFRSAILIEPATRRAVALTCNSSGVIDSFAVALAAFDAWFGS